MRRLLLTTAAGAALSTLIATPAFADTLREALLKAYQSNPTLTGERASLRANDENVPIARSSGLPTVNGTSSYNESIYNSNGGNGPPRQAQVGASLNVPIYSGGSVRNSVRAAETRVDAGRANLRGVESGLFTDVVSVYNDVIRDESIVRLNQQNVHVLEVNLQATRDRFEVGDLTRTDVAQSEARLAIAQGQLRTAESRLVSSRENYIRVVGAAPGTLEVPPPLPNLPADPQSAVTTAIDENPVLLAAQKQRDATRFDVDVAKSGRMPRVGVSVGPSYNTYLGSVGNSAAAAGFRNSGFGVTGGLNLTLPLFQAGRVSAQVRQAEARRSAAFEGVTEAERGVIAQTRSAFANWKSSQHVIESSEVAVSANKLSLEGVRAENSVGTRTILDILNAEQELLNSQVTLVTARRDAYVAGFALLAAMGQAEASDLNLEGGPLYDPTVNYNRVRHKIGDWGSDGEPQPVATRTNDTPAQTPDVAPDRTSGDPALQPAVDSSPRNPPTNPR